ncbi:MAG: glycosyltransferase [Planctomycetota bacterium]
MKLLYPLCGDPTHGLHRYARLLSKGVAEAGTDCQTVACALTGDEAVDAAAIDAVIDLSRDADVCHYQFNPRVWGGGAASVLRNLSALHQRCACPCVVTIHDAAELPGAARTLRPRRVAGPAWAQGGYTTAVRDALRSGVRHARTGRVRKLRRRVLAELSTAPAARVVFNRLEASFLESLPGAGRVEVVPHFVEPRSLGDGPPSDARFDIPEDALVVTSLGFIHERKGSDLLIEALPKLPRNAIAVLAGEPVRSRQAAAYADGLRRLAEQLGVAARVRWTGFLEDEALEWVLRRTDIAVCPFRSVSASGTLSTWLSAGKPILASRLPQLEEYERLAPGAIRFFKAGDQTRFSQELVAAVSAGPGDGAAARGLLQRLSMEQIAADHLAIYRGCTAVSPGHVSAPTP